MTIRVGWRAGGRATARARSLSGVARAHEPTTVRIAAPGWLEPSLAASAVVIAVSATMTATPPHRLVVGFFLGIAIVPFLTDLSPRTPLPDSVRVAVPLAGLAVVQVGGAHWGWVGDDPDTQMALLLGILVVTEACSVASVPIAVASVVGVSAILVGRQLQDTYLLVGIVWPAAVAFGVGVGVMIRLLLRTMDELAAAQGELANEAVRAERQRIARDVHDVVAHSMTVSMLHMTAARMALERGDDAAAVEALEEAERAGRSSLRDVRSTVGLLRDDDQSPLDAPEPTADDIDELVASWQHAGMEVELRREPDTTGIGDATGLTLFRVVQESLANAARHLPEAANCVELARHEGAVEVVVSSTGATPSPTGDGHGLVGMRERVEALGGRVLAGPRPDGWRVEAVLPFDGPVGSVPT